MKKITVILICFFTNMFLFSQKSDKNNLCPEIYRNNFTKILHEKYVTVNENDTITFNELRYECVFAYSYTQHALYNKFGKWNTMIFPANYKLPILMWKKVDLFGDGKNMMYLPMALKNGNISTLQLWFWMKMELIY